MYNNIYEFDFKGNIEQMRKNYEKAWFKNEKLPHPKWLANKPADPLNLLYVESKQLFKHGKIYYASLVQANEIMFQQHPTNDCPANIVLGESEYFDENPIALRRLARELGSYKGTDDAPDELKRITDSITGELERLYNIPLPKSFSNNQTAYFSTIMIFRKHLPNGRLDGLLFPMLSCPNELSSSIILPYRYWTKDFRKFFVNGFVNGQ